MIPVRKLAVAIPLLSGAILAACSADATEPAARQPGGRAASAFAAQRSVSPFDSSMSVLGDDVPGFGGMYYDKAGEPVVYLQDTTQGEVLRGTIKRHMGQMRGFADRPMHVRRADFDIRQLIAWRSDLEPLLDRNTVSVLQVASSINRLHVGVKSADAIGDVRLAAARAGIPEQALHISVAQMSTLPASANARLSMMTTTLSDRIRPVPGGVQIGMAHLSGNPHDTDCTLGLALKKSGSSQLYLLTNSHCTRTIGAVDTDAWMFQGIIPTDSIGYETDDPAFYSVPGCGGSTNCRWSDAALFQATTSASNIGFGTVAQTVNYPTSGTWGVAGSRDVTGTFTITGELPDSWLVPGQFYSKMGNSTGWTSGYILSIANGDFMDGSCVLTTHIVTGRHLLCQYFGTTYVFPGDSGSPVFIRATSSTINLLGLAWGYGQNITTGQNYSIFSSIGDVRNDLGSLVTY